MAVIDLLASEYGWNKDYILDHVYPDEALELTGLINRRVNNRYLMELMIISNPWTKDPKSLVRELERRINSDMDLGETEETDHLAFQKLKSKISGRSKKITVK